MSTNILVNFFESIPHLRHRTSKMVSQEPKTPQSIFTWLFPASIAEGLEQPSMSPYCGNWAEKNHQLPTQSNIAGEVDALSYRFNNINISRNGDL